MARWLIIFGGAAVLFLAFASNTESDTSGDSTVTTSSAPPNLANKITQLAAAITVAEGSPPSINNPGDLTKSFGYPTNGVFNSEGVLKFVNASDGAAALVQECTLILTGTSSVYTLQDTIYTMAVKYAGQSGAANWAANIAATLGIDQDTVLGDWINE